VWVWKPDSLEWKLVLDWIRPRAVDFPVVWVYVWVEVGGE
jgi:hypothetical protein